MLLNCDFWSLDLWSDFITKQVRQNNLATGLNQLLLQDIKVVAKVVSPFKRSGMELFTNGGFLSGNIIGNAVQGVDDFTSQINKQYFFGTCTFSAIIASALGGARPFDITSYGYKGVNVLGETLQAWRIYNDITAVGNYSRPFEFPILCQSLAIVVNGMLPGENIQGYYDCEGWVIEFDFA